MILREFFLKLGLDFQAAEFARAQIAVEGLKVGLSLIVRGAEAVASGIAGMVKSTVAAGDRIDEMSQAAGISTDSLQEMAYAASFSSMSTEETAHAMGLLSRTMREASQGGSEAAKAFAQIGVAVTKGGKLRAGDEVVGDLAEKFASMPDGAQKTALAMQVFGRSGARMIPFLNAGRAGLEKLRQEARDLGVVLDQDTIKNSAATADAMDRVKHALTGVKYAIVGPLLPAIKAMADALTKWIAANRVLIAQRIHKVLHAVGVAARALWIVLKPIGRVLGLMVDNLGAVAAILGGYLLASLFATASAAAAASGGFVSLGLSSLAAGAKSLAAWTLAALPILVLTALLAAVVLIFQDIWTELNGGEGVFSALYNKWNKWVDSFWHKDGDPWWLDAIGTFLHIVQDLPQAFADALDFWKAKFDAMIDWMVNKLVDLGIISRVQAEKGPYSEGSLLASGGGQDFSDVDANGRQSHDFRNIGSGDFGKLDVAPIQNLLAGMMTRVPAASPGNFFGSQLPGVPSGGKNYFKVDIKIDAPGATKDSANAIGSAATKAMDDWLSAKLRAATVGIQ